MPKVVNRIELCGGIATGKTTICQILQANGIPVIYENLDELPFRRDFISNPTAFAVEMDSSLD